MFELSSYTVSYSESVIENIDLRIKKGERILILAEPASGKSTLAKSLTGALDKFYDGCTSGSIIMDGKDLSSLDVLQRSTYISRVSQDSLSSMLFSTINEEIAFPLENRNTEIAIVKRELEYLKSTYELSSLEDADPSALSGGEKRRVSLATADSQNARLVIYDESFDELSSRFREILKREIAKKDYAIVLSSHYISCYDDFFTAVYTIKNKRLVPLPSVLKTEISVTEKAVEGSLVIRNLKAHTERKECARIFNLSIEHLSFQRGRFYIISGDNGSGKSTLAKVISGLIKEDEGEILIDSKVLKEKERRRKISYLAQNPYSSLFLPTVSDELDSVVQDRKEKDRIMSLFSISPSSYIHEISYGEAKRVQSAVFYALKRPFVILDELDSALSYKESQKIINLFLENGSGVILITHDENYLARENIIKLKDGTLA